MKKIEKALQPQERMLRTQERFRRRLGVKEVDQPTYCRYITGPIERFDRKRNAFMCLNPDNPYGEEFRRSFKARTGHDHWRDPLPYKELDTEDRIGQSLSAAGWRLCNEYFPKALPVTPPEGKVELSDPKWNSRLIKKVAMFFGAELVRITELDQRWVYKGINIPHKYAIVVVVSHARSMNATAPDHLSWLSAVDTYSRLKFITTQLADFICGLGYEAMYRETLGWNPEVLMVPLAIDAGVGEFARNGRVLSPEFGINMRTKPVTTDLPLEPDKPISFGTHDFCMSCEHCAIYCPTNAIPFGEPTEKPPTIHNNPGFRKWWVRADRCLTFWAMNKKKWLSCGGRCIAVCPWNKPRVPFHNTVRWLAIHGPKPLKKFLVWGDKVAYHRKKSIKKRVNLED
ncbi:MAG: reductive dehalogenase [Desulfarculus sp.]|jgi:reductive dehalogenase|nr:MAG: reductive dehalogenase [Desulfarculus sp.]